MDDWQYVVDKLRHELALHVHKAHHAGTQKGREHNYAVAFAYADSLKTVLNALKEPVAPYGDPPRGEIMLPSGALKLAREWLGHDAWLLDGKS